MDLITPKIKKTIVNVISKSGETAETASQFILFRDLLQQKLGKKYKENILATTDAKGGTLREICKAEGFRTLEVPEGVGGRFSVMSAVGLFSAAMCGIDIDALLDRRGGHGQAPEGRRPVQKCRRDDRDDQLSAGPEGQARSA